MRCVNKLNPIAVFSVIALSLTVAAIAVIGCGWSGTSHSVRFNGYQSEREMGRLPPLPNMANGSNAGRRYWDTGDDVWEEEDQAAFDDYSTSEDGSKKIDSLWERAAEAETNGTLTLARHLLVEYLKQGAAQTRRNSANDRLDALNALSQGASSAAISAYLKARRCHDQDKRDSCEVGDSLDIAARDRNLKDNVAYLKAAEIYRQKNFAEAAAAFKLLARQFPHSEKREAALFMNAISTMKTSTAYIAASGNAHYDYGESVDIKIDQAWQDAYTGFQAVIDGFPQGRYFNDARSWQAYLHLRRRDRAAALAQYYRLLADEREEKARIDAAFSLTLVRSPATDDELTRVEQDLADEPQAALTYAYHNIYNYSIDPGPAWPPYETVKDAQGNYDYEASRARQEQIEKDWREDRESTQRKELLRTLAFSKRLIANYPRLSIGGAFALRAAQASEELEDNKTAIEFAQRALRSSLKADERTQALWTLGVAQHRSGEFAGARASFEKLLRENPNSTLTEGARRLLAMIAEDAGDIDAALEQYIALKYDLDEAYFVDYLMTPEQLAAFIQKHPDSPKKNEFTYALGVRYLRLNRWKEARQTFAQVKTSSDSDFNYYCSTCDCEPGETSNCVDPKADSMTTESDATGRKSITPALLLRDMQTANDLEALEGAAAQAATDEEKAEALYQYASYQYKGSSLLFYNPLATPGYYNLGQFAGEGAYRVPNEGQRLFESQQEHDRLARSLKIYLDIAQRFPQTRAARDALYTAAVCHERLSNYNPYWREIYGNGLHAGERMVTYANVRATYPDYQLPRGTYGWEPSTRTVNGGPGWASAPKPPTRLTKRERMWRFLDGLNERLIRLWHEDGKRWLTEIAIVSGLAFVFPIARRNRRRWKVRIIRWRQQQAKQVVTYPWFELFWIDPEKPSRREQIRRALQERQEEFIAIARDHRTRPVLLRNVLAQGAVAGLVVGLVWTVCFG